MGRGRSIGSIFTSIGVWVQPPTRWVSHLANPFGLYYLARVTPAVAGNHFSSGIPLFVFDQATLQDLGNLGEFVGALGVVFSMIYLAKEMKQNTISVRAASFNEMVQNSIRLSEHAFRDSEFAEFLNRAQEEPSALTPAERVRWDAYMTAVFRHFGNLVYQYRVGALDQQMWESYARTLEDHLRRTPSWLDWFEANQDVFSTSLVEQVAGARAILEAERQKGASEGGLRAS